MRVPKDRPQLVLPSLIPLAPGGTCLWPMWDKRAPMEQPIFCNAPRKTDTRLPYCHQHWFRAVDQDKRNPGYVPGGFMKRIGR